ncbi:GFA family protein [Stutzerimonas kirkiae]|nr:GFA family protein [Stutzerimonas kirkiae]
MHKGSCLCGAVSFRLGAQPKAVSNCHCRMCQKQHGAAFATYASVRRTDLEYLSGEELMVAYNSSANIRRKFCGVCGSNIEWGGSEAFPDWLSIPITLLDTYFDPGNIKDINLASKVCWL